MLFRSPASEVREFDGPLGILLFSPCQQPQSPAQSGSVSLPHQGSVNLTRESQIETGAGRMPAPQRARRPRYIAHSTPTSR